MSTVSILPPTAYNKSFIKASPNPCRARVIGATLCQVSDSTSYLSTEDNVCPCKSDPPDHIQLAAPQLCQHDHFAHRACWANLAKHSKVGCNTQHKHHP